MNFIRLFTTAACAATALLLGACATPTRQATDYTAYKASRPQSILVLPPLNNSPDVMASYGLLSTVTVPLAESGYYVMPVTLVAETFKQNGLTVPTDMHEVPVTKLREIFGADAALYIVVQRYGSTYTVLDSAAIVSADARLVDLRSGQLLWSGSATASSAENSGGNQGGLPALLIAAIVKQILNNTTDMSFKMAGVASQRLLGAGRPNGLLYGQRSPKYGTD